MWKIGAIDGTDETLEIAQQNRVESARILNFTVGC